MQTYAKQKGKPFDWNKFLDKAITKGVTASEQSKAEKLAGDWVTCACGNQCSILEREGDGEPVDSELNTLGLDFNDEIHAENYRGAKKTLQAIEKRSAKLIAEKENEAIKTLEALGYKFR